MKPFFKGFVYAGRGIARAVRSERNFRFHLCAAAYVLAFSRFYSLTSTEYAVLAVVITGVLALELVNTSLERVVDRISADYDAAAGLAKDLAAGAVLVFCAGAVCCGFLLFWDVAVFKEIFAYFGAHLWALGLLAASLAFCAWFVFGLGDGKKGAREDANRDETA